MKQAPPNLHSYLSFTRSFRGRNITEEHQDPRGNYRAVVNSSQLCLALMEMASIITRS